jgi:hypothetical protein
VLVDRPTVSGSTIGVLLLLPSPSESYSLVSRYERCMERWGKSVVIASGGDARVAEEEAEGTEGVVLSQTALPMSVSRAWHSSGRRASMLGTWRSASHAWSWRGPEGVRCRVE